MFSTLHGLSHFDLHNFSVMWILKVLFLQIKKQAGSSWITSWSSRKTWGMGIGFNTLLSVPFWHGIVLYPATWPGGTSLQQEFIFSSIRKLPFSTLEVSGVKGLQFLYCHCVELLVITEDLLQKSFPASSQRAERCHSQTMLFPERVHFHNGGVGCHNIL